MRHLRLTAVLALLAALVVAAPASAHEEEGSQLARRSALAQMEDPPLMASDNMRHVTNVAYELLYPETEQLSHGTDIEFYSVDLGAPPPPPDGPGGPDGPGEPEVPGAPEVTGPTVTRLNASSDAGTAVAVSRSEFDSAESIVLATFEDYADALAGTSLAADRGVPLLLSARDELSPETADEIERLGATEAVLLGRENALTAEVEADLAEAGVSTSRIGGANRWETAADIMDELPAATEVLLVEGDNADPQRGWPDALSAATLGAFESRPILLAPEFQLPDETAAKLSQDLDVTILGGTAAINADVERQIDERAGTVRRLAGDDRYATSALAATEAIARGVDPATVYVATGTNYTDGLVSGAAAGARGGFLLLVDGQDLDGSPESEQVLVDNADAISQLFITGGIDAINSDTEGRLREAVAPPAQEGSGSGGEEASEDPSEDPSDEPTDNPTEEPPTDDNPTDNNDPEDPDAPLADGQRSPRKFGMRDFALAGSYQNGLQIIDITDPEAPEIASVYDCGVLQGDVQVFERDGRTYITYTSENSSSLVVESRCVADAAERGDIVFEDANGDGEITTSAEKSPAYGTYIADVTDPYAPVSAGFIPVIEGSHNGSIHPSGNFFYNSDSALINDVTPEIQVYDISDFANIERVAELPLIPLPGLGTSSHDITFNADGTRGYSAALSQTVILNTEDPANPSMITTFSDPAIETEHQADPMTVTDSEGNERTILVAEDELIGALEGNTCPGGGVHFYDITGDNELDPLANKIGVFFIPEFRPAGPAVTGVGTDIIEDEFGESGTCTAHVFRLYPEEGIMTLAWYNAGVRVVDISGLADAAALPASPLMPTPECGFAFFENSDTWSAKTNRIEEDGSFYLYANDIIRGFDVFRYTGGACQGQEEGAGEAAGSFLKPQEALAEAQARAWPGAEHH